MTAALVTQQAARVPRPPRTRTGPSRTVHFVAGWAEHEQFAGQPAPWETVDSDADLLSEALTKARQQATDAARWWTGSAPPAGMLNAILTHMEEPSERTRTAFRREGFDAAVQLLCRSGTARALAYETLMDATKAGLSYAEIADQRGVSGQAVEQAAGRLRDQLQREFAFTATLRPTAPGKRIPHHQPASTDTAQEAVASH